jgi:2'-5' RNA ligase
MVTSLGRAFVAVVPPREVLDAVARAVDGVRDGAPVALRWMRREQWHLTLQFLGPVGDAEALAGSLAASVGACPGAVVRLGVAGAFPSPARAGVLWIGLTEGVARLVAIAAAVEAGTAPLSFAPEPRAYHPHLTVARSARPHDLRPLVGALGAEPVGPRWAVDAAVLLESDTRPGGAVYTEVARLPLAPAP